MLVRAQVRHVRMRRKVQAARVPVLAVHARVAQGIVVLVVAGAVSRRVKARDSASTRMVTLATRQASPPITPTQVSARTVRPVLPVVQAVGVRVRAVFVTRRLSIAAPVAAHAVQVARHAGQVLVRQVVAIVAPPVAVIAVAELRYAQSAKKTAL